MRAERSMRLRQMASMPGWADVLEMAREYAAEFEDEIRHMMAVTPDKLTGKMAIARANRAKGVRDLIESIENEIKISEPHLNPHGDRQR